MLKPAVIGKDGRTSAIVCALESSLRVGRGGTIWLSNGKISDHGNDELQMINDIVKAAVEARPDFVVVGPEEPLAAGVVDALKKVGISSVGPTRSLARLEVSKSWTRELVRKYRIPGNPRYRVFSTKDGVADFIESLDCGFVVKPDGLTGGKGVKVSGDHLDSMDDGIAYACELLDAGKKVVIEEKLEGEEFSLMAFCDGVTVKDMVVVQDHKRAHEDDTGPNTGGMGSYSCEDHGLPFITEQDLDAARAINAEVAKALLAETGEAYKGILYGGFMATRDGVRLLEYNARFGDPETMNVLAILESDFAGICLAMVEGRLDQVEVKFAKKATVCKYLVPKGYPENPVKGEPIDLAGVKENSNLRMFLAALDPGPGGSKIMTGSRTLAFVGIGATLAEAEASAEEAVVAVEKASKNLFHRPDIGTQRVIEKRIQHMRMLRSSKQSDRKPSLSLASV